MKSSFAVIEDTVEVGKGNFVPVSILKAEGDKTMSDKKGGGGSFPSWAIKAAWVVGAYVAFMYIAVPELCDKFGILCKLDRPAQSARMLDSLPTPRVAPSSERQFTIGGELNRRMHGGQQQQRRQPVAVQGVDRSPPPCAGTLRRNEADTAWVCRVYY